MENFVKRRLRQGFKYLKLEDEQFEAIVTVILRVPGYFILDYSYQYDIRNCIPRSFDWPDIVSSGFAIFAVVQGILVLLLPLEQLVSLYMHYLTIALLAGSDFFSKYYVKAENELVEKWPEYGSVSFQGYSNMLMLQQSLFDETDDIVTIFLRKQVAAIVFHTIVATLVSFFLDLEANKDKIPLLVYLIPVFARLVGCPVSDLQIAHNFASIAVIFLTVQYIFVCVPRVFRFMRNVYNDVVLMVHWYGTVGTFTKIFQNLFVPKQIFLFWFILFSTQVYCHIVSDTAITVIENSLFDITTFVKNASNIDLLGGPKSELVGNVWYLLFLQSAAEVCTTPIMLLGMCVSISFVTKLILKLIYSFISGIGGTPDLSNSYFTGITVAVLAIQTSLTSLQLPQRVAVLSLLLRIAVTSLVQNAYELVEPQVMGLSTHGFSIISKHIRAVVVLLFLLGLPIYMVYSLALVFDKDIWLLIMASANLITSIQVFGLTIIYILLTCDAAAAEPWPSLDDHIYHTRAGTRVLEFTVALFLVGIGLKDSVLGEWSWINGVILISHAYFNVWQKLQQGWKSFLLRMEAAKKLSSLPEATKQQLLDHDDVCPVCYSKMANGACITNCKHIFHITCLRKCLYIQDKCPLCHSPILPEPEVVRSIEEEVGNTIPYVDDDTDSEYESDAVDTRENPSQ